VVARDGAGSGLTHQETEFETFFEQKLIAWSQSLFFLTFGKVNF
jgi:hypothetical protein